MVAKVVAREGGVCALGFVEHWDVRSIPRSCTSQLSISAEPSALSPIKHSGYRSKCSNERSIMLCRQDFGLADRCRRLDIDNDRVVGTDEILVE